MKRILLFAFLFTITTIIAAQVPLAIKYQAVVRDGSGHPVSNQLVSLRLSVLDGSSSGPVLYSEYHTITTNNFGLVNLNIGKGTVITGNFQSIPWNSADQWLRMELDTTGGSNYQISGSAQLLTVPYAFYADVAGSGVSGFELDCPTTSNSYYTIRGSGFGEWECENFLRVSDNAVGINTNPNSSYDLRVNGNVGIGSSPSSSYELSVDGDVRIDDHLGVGFSTSTSYEMDIDGEVRIQDGLGIGTAPPYSGLYVGSSSNFYVKTSLGSGSGTPLVISYGEVKKDNSSIRFKEKIANLTFSKANLFKLRPVTYIFNPDAGGDGTKDVGLIAEEVDTLIPDLVIYDYDENGKLRPESVKYNRLPVYLLEIIKEQDNEINILKKEIESIKNELVILKSGGVSD